MDEKSVRRTVVDGVYGGGGGGALASIAVFKSETSRDENTPETKSLRATRRSGLIYVSREYIVIFYFFKFFQIFLHDIDGSAGTELRAVYDVIYNKTYYFNVCHVVVLLTPVCSWIAAIGPLWTGSACFRSVS